MASAPQPASDDVPFTYEYQGDGLWVAAIDSVWGPVEFLVNGTEERPYDDDLATIGRFLENAQARILHLRRQLPWGTFYRPIRVSVTRQQVVGVQFQHRLLPGRRHMVLEGAESKQRK